MNINMKTFKRSVKKLCKTTGFCSYVNHTVYQKINKMRPFSSSLYLQDSLFVKQMSGPSVVENYVENVEYSKYSDKIQQQLCKCNGHEI
jgi:hypothetical protein